MKLRQIVPMYLLLAVLAGCGSIYPGAAAVVDGEEIFRTQVDKLASTYCLYVSGQGREVSQLDARRQAAADLIAEKVMDDVFAKEGVEVVASEYRLTSAERNGLEEFFKNDTEAIINLIERNNRIQKGAQKLLRRTDTEIPDADLSKFSTQLILQYVGEARVEIDPRLAIANDLSGAVPSGSISIPDNSGFALNATPQMC